ncbi:MAG TPA: CYTH and CHAD domain-containing protein [Acidimicrobiales bacterium]
MTGPSDGKVEREVKLGAWPGFAMPDLTDVAPGVTVEVRPALDLDATYVDTADLALVRNGASLRRRTGEGAPRWTLKLPAASSEASSEASSMSRREFDVEDDTTVVPPVLAKLVTGWVRRAPLAPVTVIRSHRERTALLGAEGSQLAEIDDDEVSVIDGDHVAARFREVEVELVDGSEDLLHLVAEALVAAGAGAPDPTPKVARALGPRALIPPDLIVGSPEPTAPMADVVTAALRRSVRQIVDHDHVIRLDDDPEGVHKMRVGTRRLRSDLQTLEPVLDGAWADELRSDLKELAAELGIVRDADVLLERLWRAVEDLPAADRAVGARVVHRLEEERRALQGELIDVLDSVDYVGLLEELASGALRPRLGTRARERADQVLPELVRPRWRRLRKAVEGLGASPTDDELHQVRILAKRTRYAADLASPVVGDAAADLASRLADIQDVLGDLHDTVVAEDWLRRTLPALDHEARFVSGELVAAQRSERAALRGAWPAAWAACDRKALTRWLR